MNYRLMQNIIVVFIVFLLSACSTLETRPKNTSNLCVIFAEKTAWFDQNESVFEKWQLPVYVQMAIIWQESHFVADAKPARSKILGIIPATRPSTAYGYAQALDGTWEDYLKNSARSQASRDNFADACDFIGWYCHISYKELGISKLDVYNLYLAYHEGFAGYKRKSYLSKPWLLTVAKKVSSQARQYQQQLNDCQN